MQIADLNLQNNTKSTKFVKTKMDSEKIAREMGTNTEQDLSLDNKSDNSETGLSIETIVAISIGTVGIVVVVCAAYVVCRYLVQRKRKQGSRKVHVTDNIQVEHSDSIKLPTLGNAYKISSVLNILSDRKPSIPGDRKYSTVSDLEQRERLMLTTDQISPIIKNNYKPASSHSSHESIVKLMESEPGTDVLLESKRTRLMSTYLEVTPPSSRRSSRTSQQVTMKELECQAQMVPKIKTAPLAEADSIPSLPAKSLENLKVMSHAKHDFRLKVASRPCSEGIFDDDIPSLPPKKFTRMTKSTVNVKGGLNPHQKRSGCAKALQVSKSEACIFDTSDDEDDFVDISELPSIPVPPKIVPNLPPKQKINKSSEFLQQIDSSFKKSLNELYHEKDVDVDYEEPVPSSKVPEDLPTSVSNGGRYSPTDYDEPPTDRLYTKSLHSLQAHEFEDYDEPIHHHSVLTNPNESTF